jgi:hypothetical protein
MDTTVNDRTTGQWSARTRSTYTTDWRLFTDWCDATDHRPLPADPATVLAFLGVTTCPIRKRC